MFRAVCADSSRIERCKVTRRASRGRPLRGLSVVIALIASSCTSSVPMSGSPPASGTERDESQATLSFELDRVVAVLDCDSRIATKPEVVSQIGGFAALASREVHQLGPRAVDRDSLPSLRFSKIALIIRNGSTFTIRAGRAETAHGADQDVLIGWSNSVRDEAPVEEVQVQNCFPGTDGSSVYSGGVWVEEPGCIELIFATGSEPMFAVNDLSIDVPVGASCPST